MKENNFFGSFTNNFKKHSSFMIIVNYYVLKHNKIFYAKRKYKGRVYKQYISQGLTKIKRSKIATKLRTS